MYSPPIPRYKAFKHPIRLPHLPFQLLTSLEIIIFVVCCHRLVFYNMAWLNYLTRIKQWKRRVVLKGKHISVFSDWFPLSLAILQHTKNHELNLSYYLAIVMSQINKYWIHSFTVIFISSIIFPVVSMK